MNLKHKLLSDYQFISDDKIITLIKSGTILENYTYKEITIDKEIIDSNPQYFEIFDWKSELILFMKKSKIPQPAVLSKKLIPFISELVASNDKPLVIDTNDRLKDKESEYKIRIERLERKEKEYQEDLESLKEKEDSYRNDLIRLTDREKELQVNLKEINTKQREYDVQLLESISETTLEEKYKRIEEKLMLDNKELHIREKNLQEYNDYLDEKIIEIENWKSIVLNKWNHDLYPIPKFPIIVKFNYYRTSEILSNNYYQEEKDIDRFVKYSDNYQKKKKEN